MSNKAKLIFLSLSVIALASVSLLVALEIIPKTEKITVKQLDHGKGAEVKKPESVPSQPEKTPAKPDEKSAAEKDAEVPPPPQNPAEEKPAEISALKMTKVLVSWGFSAASGRKIDTVIIHSSYNALGGDKYALDKLIAEYKEYGVAPHYLIDREGRIYLLVEEKNIAYHAGESKVPDGRSGVNNFSIGIELMNTEDDKYTSLQYSSLNKLLGDIKSRHEIKYVLGHNDIAPGRKTDPWNFDWKKVD